MSEIINPGSFRQFKSTLEMGAVKIDDVFLKRWYEQELNKYRQELAAAGGVSEDELHLGPNARDSIGLLADSVQIIPVGKDLIR